jgi:hypothetical protein
MLRTVNKKVGKTVELEIFPAPLGALHNNPPQRGGLKHTPKFRPSRAMPIRVALEGAKEKRIGSLCVT